MRIEYIQDENGMLIPDIHFPKKIVPTGKYGNMRRDYLFNHRRHRYDEMLLNGTLNDHLQVTQKAAMDMLTYLTERMERDNPPSEELTFQERAAQFKQIHMDAELTVLDEVVFKP